MILQVRDSNEYAKKDLDYFKKREGSKQMLHYGFRRVAKIVSQDPLNKENWTPLDAHATLTFDLIHRLGNTPARD
jgi:hypothetical protein